MQVFLYFPAFVAVFLLFFWPVIGLAEGVFAVTYGLAHHIQRLRHIGQSFVKGSQLALCQPPAAISPCPAGFRVGTRLIKGLNELFDYAATDPFKERL